MNRLVLIGNGFDLAHNLKTSYKDFINWYWCQKLFLAATQPDYDCNDLLCKMTPPTGESWFSTVFYDKTLKDSLDEGKGIDIFYYLLNNNNIGLELSPFFERIHKNIVNKGWVDIENDYYELLKKYALEDNNESKVKELNEQLQFIQDKLVVYLKAETQKEVKPIKSIESAIYGPLYPQEIAISELKTLKDHIDGGVALSDDEWKQKLKRYGYTDISKESQEIRKYKEMHQGAALITKKIIDSTKKALGYKKSHNVDINLQILFSPYVFYLPNDIMLLNFNYTNIAELYDRPLGVDKSTIILSPINQIHGTLAEPNSVIFGYGDEMDEEYKEIVKKNENQNLRNIKSIKYLESASYRFVLNFIESEPYQIVIMGHSCGNSDRTLLNTLFEHKNCVSIKPYYYINEKGNDNYLEIVQNISRNFSDMKLMRDRVVNKTFCGPLVKKEEEDSEREMDRAE